MTNVYPLQHRIYQANHRLLCFEFRRPVIFEVWMYPIRVITKLPNYTYQVIQRPLVISVAYVKSTFAPVPLSRGTY
jgi:hypothetical protein